MARGAKPRRRLGHDGVWVCATGRGARRRPRPDHLPRQRARHVPRRPGAVPVHRRQVRHPRRIGRRPGRDRPVRHRLPVRLRRRRQGRGAHPRLAGAARGRQPVGERRHQGLQHPALPRRGARHRSHRAPGERRRPRADPGRGGEAGHPRLRRHAAHPGLSEINTRDLRPKAARDNFARDQAHWLLRDRLGDIIVAHFEHLRDAEPQRLSEILAYHDFGIKAA